MSKLDTLTMKLENQIEAMFETLCSIQELEFKKWPARHLNNRAKTQLWFLHQWMLMRSLWDKFEWKDLNIEQRKILVQEIWETTYEHFKELYWFDSKEIANNSII